MWVFADLLTNANQMFSEFGSVPSLLPCRWRWLSRSSRRLPGCSRPQLLDVPGGHQPITNEDGTVIVAFNSVI